MLRNGNIWSYIGQLSSQIWLIALPGLSTINHTELSTKSLLVKSSTRLLPHTVGYGIGNNTTAVAVVAQQVDATQPVSTMAVQSYHRRSRSRQYGCDSQHRRVDSSMSRCRTDADVDRRSQHTRVGRVKVGWRLRNTLSSSSHESPRKSTCHTYATMCHRTRKPGRSVRRGDGRHSTAVATDTANTRDTYDRHRCGMYRHNTHRNDRRTQVIITQQST